MENQKELFEFQKKLFEKEIDQLHIEFSRFDSLSFQIKGWSITVWSALVAFGAKEKVPVVILASIPAILTFWTIDAIFKSYQRRHLARLGAIERFLDPELGFSEHNARGVIEHKLRDVFEKEDFGNFPVHDLIASRTRKLNPDFNKRYKERTNFLKTVTVSNVLYFYAFLILTSLIATYVVNIQLLP